MNSPLLEVRELNMHFPLYGGLFKKQVGSVFAVNDVSFTLDRGETLGIVGESGCGKTTLGRTIVQLYQATSGAVFFESQQINTLQKRDLKSLRRSLQMIFQDPYASLNPRMTVGNILEEPLTLHRLGSKAERSQKVENLMSLVGLRPDDRHKFPHEFSGGQRQRIGIARSLMLNPKLIVADEPVSALDVSIQSQVLNLLVSLQKKLKLTYIFISHDLTVVKYISDRIIIMYLGRMVEMGPAERIYQHPSHPYTQALISAVPRPDPKMKVKGITLEGDVPSPSDPPPGCPFHQRCIHAKSVCREDIPKLEPLGQTSRHLVACHLKHDLSKGASS